MKIKLGKLEFTDWVTPEGWYTPYRFIPTLQTDTDVDFIKQPMPDRYLGYVIVNYSGNKKWFVEFNGIVEHLDSHFTKKDYVSYKHAQEDVDRFLIKISKLAAFF